MLRIIIISSDWGHVLIGIWSWRLDFWFRIGSTWKNQIDWIKREYSLWKWCELDEIIPVWLTKLKCMLLGKIFYGIYQPSQFLFFLSFFLSFLFFSSMSLIRTDWVNWRTIASLAESVWIFAAIATRRISDKTLTNAISAFGYWSSLTGNQMNRNESQSIQSFLGGIRNSYWSRNLVNGQPADINWISIRWLQATCNLTMNPLSNTWWHWQQSIEI